MFNLNPKDIAEAEKVNKGEGQAQKDQQEKNTLEVGDMVIHRITKLPYEITGFAHHNVFVKDARGESLSFHWESLIKVQFPIEEEPTKASTEQQDPLQIVVGMLEKAVEESTRRQVKLERIAKYVPQLESLLESLAYGCADKALFQNLVADIEGT